MHIGAVHRDGLAAPQGAHELGSFDQGRVARAEGWVAEAKLLELSRMVARAESQHETTTAQLVDVGRVAREQEGRSVVDATDQRAQPNALGEAREHGEACPTVA